VATAFSTVSATEVEEGVVTRLNSRR